MPEFKATSRYQITNPSDPSRWRDLSAEGDAAAFIARHVGERTKVFRVLIPKGRHAFGEEFPLFNRERSDMDSAWSAGGTLPRSEVGIVHRLGVGVSPVVCDKPSDPADLIKVLSNTYLEVEVNGESVLEGSLETLPTGLGLHADGIVNNGLPAADAVPDRVPFLFTNEAMEFSGKLSFPRRDWLRDAVGDSSSGGGAHDDDDDVDRDTTRDCDDDSHSSSNHCVTLNSDVLVTFYMTGVFGRVDDSDG